MVSHLVEASDVRFQFLQSVFATTKFAILLPKLGEFPVEGTAPRQLLRSEVGLRAARTGGGALGGNALRLGSQLGTDRLRVLRKFPQGALHSLQASSGGAHKRPRPGVQIEALQLEELLHHFRTVGGAKLEKLLKPSLRNDRSAAKVLVTEPQHALTIGVIQGNPLRR